MKWFLEMPILNKKQKIEESEEDDLESTSNFAPELKRSE